ncbi:MAG: ROK family protein [Methanobacterium sp.]|uniref:ROK family protein n=1 Tax=Methanobacterium sp. TaxID=2164 RepID=UPI003D64F257|nr:ROK family protein [Methanobacterium sp.]
MMMVSMITRRLKKGKTYEDFRKAWYHTIGFGMDSDTPPKPPLGHLYTVVNAFDPQEIIVIGFGPEISEESLKAVLNIDVKDRLDNPLDDVIEPEIGRSFGVLVSEDDFSPEGELEYQNPSVSGVKTDIKELKGLLSLVKTEIEVASAKRDRAKKKHVEDYSM